MKKSGRTMKQSTKTLLIICLICLVLGTGLVTVGFLKGPSTWAIWDGKQMSTSNTKGTYGEKKELSPFSSVEIGIPSGTCKIQEGETFSIDYQSNWPGITPVLKEKDGKLSLTAESAEEATVLNINPVAEMANKQNYIIITVPYGTKLDTIELTQEPEGKYNAFYVYPTVTVTNIKANEFKCDGGFYTIPLYLTNCEIDQLALSNVNSLGIDGLKAVNAQFNRSTGGSSNLFVKNMTAERLVVTGEDSVKEKMLQAETAAEWPDNYYNQVSVEIKDSTFGTLEALGHTITVGNTRSGGSTLLATGDLNVMDSVLTGESILRSAGKMTVNTAQKLTEFNGVLAAGLGYQEGVITELADYGTPEYDNGYVTEATKSYGTQSVSLTADQYHYLQDHLYAMIYHDTPVDFYASQENGTGASAVMRLQENETRLTGEYAKYNEFINHHYTFDSEDNYIYSADVYNRKAVTYYVDHTGAKVYITQRALLYSTLTLNSAMQMQQRYALTGGASKLDAYARVSADFSFGG